MTTLHNQQVSIGNEIYCVHAIGVHQPSLVIATNGNRVRVQFNDGSKKWINVNNTTSCWDDPTN